MVLNLNLGTKNKTPSNIEGHEEYVSYIYENMKNMKRKLDGKGGAFRFSAHTINTALSIFLCGKRGYDDLRASGLLCLSSPQT